MYGFSSSNRTKIPFNDLQGVLNDQFHAVSDLFTGIRLCLGTLLYNKAILWYSPATDFARVELVTISYSKEIFEILYLASAVAGDATSVVIIERRFIT